jgi:hypothetical protein
LAVSVQSGRQMEAHKYSCSNPAGVDGWCRMHRSLSPLSNTDLVIAQADDLGFHVDVCLEQSSIVIYKVSFLYLCVGRCVDYLNASGCPRSSLWIWILPTSGAREVWRFQFSLAVGWRRTSIRVVTLRGWAGGTGCIRYLHICPTLICFLIC